MYYKFTYKLTFFVHVDMYEYVHNTISFVLDDVLLRIFSYSIGLSHYQFYSNLFT